MNFENIIQYLICAQVKFNTKFYFIEIHEFIQT